MTAGQVYPVSVTMKNTGGTAWNTAQGYKLGSQNPQDNNQWGFGRVPLPNSVAPGEKVTFNFNVSAPTTNSVYNFQWQMLQETVQWFGDFTNNVAVTVSKTVTSDTTPPPDCLPGYLFSPSTGKPCPPSTTAFVFLNNLKLGTRHPDVKELQKYLNL